MFNVLLYLYSCTLNRCHCTQSTNHLFAASKSENDNTMGWLLSTWTEIHFNKIKRSILKKWSRVDRQFWPYVLTLCIAAIPVSRSVKCCWKRDPTWTKAHKKCTGPKKLDHYFMCAPASEPTHPTSHGKCSHGLSLYRNNSKIGANDGGVPNTALWNPQCAKR